MSLLLCCSAVRPRHLLRTPTTSEAGTRSRDFEFWRKLTAAPSIDPNLCTDLVDRVREDTSPHVRRLAALALGSVQPTQKLALAVLVEVATDSDEVTGVRLAAIFSLGRLGKRSTRVAEALEQAAEDHLVAHEVIRALYEVGAPEKAKRLLEHRDAKVRAAARKAFIATGSAALLVTGLESNDPDLRRNAVIGLKNRDFRIVPLTPPETASLVKVAGDADHSIRAIIAEALKASGKSAFAVPALVKG